MYNESQRPPPPSVPLMLVRLNFLGLKSLAGTERKESHTHTHTHTHTMISLRRETGENSAANSSGTLTRSGSVLNKGCIAAVSAMRSWDCKCPHCSLFKEAIVNVSEPVNYQFLLCQELLK